LNNYSPTIVGLIFLLQDPELSSTLIRAFSGGHHSNKEDSIPLRYASVLISKGFFCSPVEIGTIIGMHLKMVSDAPKIVVLTPHLFTHSLLFNVCLYLIARIFIFALG
jgi:hypothetical protein